ncbi:hypothetical protein FRB93_005715 [Tulasnella sp. JGI-2019a]|nr:hypothetical protein FRB93_005715 [Tulasnella sp. JGI-2019a]
MAEPTTMSPWKETIPVPTSFVKAPARNRPDRLSSRGPRARIGKPWHEHVKL